MRTTKKILVGLAIALSLSGAAAPVFADGDRSSDPATTYNADGGYTVHGSIASI